MRISMNNTIEQRIEELTNEIVNKDYTNHSYSEVIKDVIFRAFTFGQELKAQEVREKVNKIKTWVFTAPYGLEIDEKENIIARKRADGEYLKFEDIISALSPNNNTN